MPHRRRKVQMIVNKTSHTNHGRKRSSDGNIDIEKLWVRWFYNSLEQVSSSVFQINILYFKSGTF